ncbi:hypothetical protein FOA52_015979 [Chlamydomonas sp. UWO 241]|nr:hypothetical protein FOA52_015979 [Chlamydomonas sp. UWO 241]
MPPESRGAEPKAEQRQKSLRYLGVRWHKASSSCSAWIVKLYNPQTKRMQHVGIFDSEEDAGRAYDFAAVQFFGEGAKRNFPGETISEQPASKERKRSSSHLGVCWDEQIVMGREAV